MGYLLVEEDDVEARRVWRLLEAIPDQIDRDLAVLRGRHGVSQSREHAGHKHPREPETKVS